MKYRENKDSLQKGILGLLGIVIVLTTLNAAIAVEEPGLPDVTSQESTVSTLSANSLNPVVTETGKISLSVDGLGTTDSGTIQVEKPTGATVRSAYMAAADVWGSYSGPLPDGAVQINSNNVNWDSHDPVNANSAWSDVTAIVKPIVDAAPAGIVGLNIIETMYLDGSILAVIFDDPSQTTDNTIVLLFGAQEIAGDTFAIGLAEPIDKSDPNLVLDMSLGISYGYQGTGQYSIVNVNDIRLTTSAGGQDDGYDGNGGLLTVGGIGDSNNNPTDPDATPTGPRSDDELYNLIPFVDDGDTAITVYTENPSHDDNIFFASLYLASTTAIVGEGILLAPVSASNPVGTQHTVTATLQDDLGNAIEGRDVTFTIVFGPHAGQTSTVSTDVNGEATFAYIGISDGIDTIEASFVDSQGETITSNSVTKEWTNNPPIADAGGPYIVNEGSPVVLDASGSTDPDGDPLTYMWDLDGDSSTIEAFGESPTFTPEDGPASLTITVLVDDGNGGMSTDTATVTVYNVAPTIDSLSSDTYLAPVGAPIQGTGTFHDPGILDTFTALWDWGDSTINSQSLPAGSTSTTYSHAYTTPGVYTVCLTVTDNDGGSDSECMDQYIVIYDPDGGFVTGGGWIDSPEGAYVADPSLTGTANFGFVSKYKKGATTPTGMTEFQFQAGDLNFHSSSYDWLVIAHHKAIYKGTGTINGDGNYGFMLFAIDEKLTPSTGVDMFRIKIWDISNNDAVVYDNEIGEAEDAPPTTAIIGGSIVIHK